MSLHSLSNLPIDMQYLLADWSRLFRGSKCVNRSMDAQFSSSLSASGWFLVWSSWELRRLIACRLRLLVGLVGERRWWSRNSMGRPDAARLCRLTRSHDMIAERPRRVQLQSSRVVASFYVKVVESDINYSSV
jgi:hypothetical protein